MAGSLDPARMLDQARRHPILVIGGAVGVGVALFAIRSSQAAPLDVAPVDPNADPTAIPAGVATDPSTYPGLGGQYQGSTYNPLLDYGQSGQQLPPQTTAEGCTLPVPNDPPGYEGKGRWVCTAGTWIFTLNQPDVNAAGCPLPKPAVPPEYAGQGDWHCVQKRWTWKWKAPPPPGGQGHPHMTIKAGTYRSWASVTAGKAAGAADFVHTGASVIFVTGPKQSGVHIPGATGKAVLVRITGAPGHPTIAGRWMRPTSDWKAQ